MLQIDKPLGLDIVFGKGATLANFTPKIDGITVFQLSQLMNNSFVVQLVYDELFKLDGCRGQKKEALVARILGIIPKKVDIANMEKGTAVWIPLSVFSSYELNESFRVLIKSFL